MKEEERGEERKEGKMQKMNMTSRGFHSAWMRQEECR